MSLDQNATLEQQIAEFNAQLATQAPPQVLDQISQYINTLIGSGVAKNALKVGEKAPSFTLPAALGRHVSLAGLLQHGPVVGTFYRGVLWRPRTRHVTPRQGWPHPPALRRCELDPPPGAIHAPRWPAHN